MLSLFSKYLNLFADEDAPSKVAKVDVPSTQFVGGMVPGSMGIGYPPQPALGAIRPMYVFCEVSCISSATSFVKFENYIFCVT